MARWPSIFSRARSSGRRPPHGLLSYDSSARPTEAGGVGCAPAWGRPSGDLGAGDRRISPSHPGSSWPWVRRAPMLAGPWDEMAVGVREAPQPGRSRSAGRALGSEQPGELGVAPVHVPAKPEHATVVDPGGPVGDVDRDRLRQRHRALSPRIDPGTDRFRRPLGIVAQRPDRQIERFFDPDAAVAEGADGAAEERRSGRVVQVDPEPVGEDEIRPRAFCGPGFWRSRDPGRVSKPSRWR